MIAVVELLSVRGLECRGFVVCGQDQVQQFYDLVHDEVRQLESEIRNAEANMEGMQHEHQEEIKAYLRKVVHLEYEHSNNIDAAQQAGKLDREAEEAGFLSRKAELNHAKLTLKEDLRREELAHENEVRGLKEVERKELQKLREEFQRNHRELEQKYQNRLNELTEDLELRRKMELHEIEERKNRHINDLIRNHDKAFAEMKAYYNAITADNLALIKTLNDDIDELKNSQYRNEQALLEMERKNELLAAPLTQAQNEVKELQAKLTNYAKDKSSLRHAKARLLALDESHKALAEQHAVMLKQYQKMEEERDTLYRTFESTIERVQHKNNEKNSLLGKMIEEYGDVFEAKKAQFTSVLRASNLDPVVLASVTKKLDDVLTAKNEQINELRYETAKVMKAHNDLVRVYEAKLSQMGVPRGELGLEPLLGHTSTAPANLVT